MIYQYIAAKLNHLSNEIIGPVIKVHKAQEPGLPESSYKECLFYEKVKIGYFAEKEKVLPLVYETVKLDIGYRIDILIKTELIVEVKSVESLSAIHTARALTDLKLSGNRLALLINFNFPLLKNGIKRLVL